MAFAGSAPVTTCRSQQSSGDASRIDSILLEKVSKEFYTYESIRSLAIHLEFPTGPGFSENGYAFLEKTKEELFSWKMDNVFLARHVLEEWAKRMHAQGRSVMDVKEKLDEVLEEVNPSAATKFKDAFKGKLELHLLTNE